jgi:hypothetical protein
MHQIAMLGSSWGQWQRGHVDLRPATDRLCSGQGETTPHERHE